MAPLPPVGPEDVFLHPGDLAFARAPCRLRTILGSCVAVICWDPETLTGGMCHYLLPEAGGSPPSPRYGEVAIPELLGRFRDSGIDPARLRIAIAGGSLCLSAQTVFFIGDKNVAIAESILGRLGLAASRREVGGERGRRILLDCRTGELGIHSLEHSIVSSVRAI